MYKKIAEKYEGLKYDRETIEMIIDILSEEKTAYKVLEALAIEKSEQGMGLSKSKMYKKIKIDNGHKNKSDTTGSSEANDIHLTRKIADKIICLLLGAGLVAYNIRGTEIVYSLTTRGVQVCLALKQKQLI